MAQPITNSWRNDLAGGAIAALAALPVELVFGLFAVAPLGPDFAHHGIRAAIWGCLLGGVLIFLLRGNGGMLTGSRSASGLVLGILAARLIEHPDIAAAAEPATLVFVLLLLCTALAGVFQFVIGLVRLGQALKFVPYPVIAGLMLGIALLLLTIGARSALGIDSRVPWSEALHDWHPASLAVAAATFGVCLWASRRGTAIPGSLLALLAGAAIHHALAAAFGADHLGGSTASVDGLVPDYSLLQTGLALGLGELLRWLPLLVSYALAIAALSSLETMLCLAAIGAEKSERPDGDRELRIQGGAMLISGILGATACIANLARVRVNLSAGGRTTLSALAYAATLAAAVLIGGRFTGLIPNAVIGGILAYYALGLVDDGTRRLAWQLATQRRRMDRRQYRLLLANALVIVVVALAVLFGDMMKALGIGVVAAVFLFVRSSAKPVIRRVLSGRAQRSLKVRSAEDLEMLAAHGERIVIVEAEGPLFFGTADRIAQEIDTVCRSAALLILDLKRVGDIDPTGARTLLQASGKARAQGKEILLAGANREVEGFLKTMGLEAVIAAGNWHTDVDQALEDAEDRLLGQVANRALQREVGLAESALAGGLSDEQVKTLEGYLRRREFGAAGKIFVCGDVGDSLFVASRSAVDILIPLPHGRHKRVASFAPGVFFGEMALLEGKARSADAVVQGAGTLWELTRDSLGRLEREQPEIACQVLRNLSRSLANRLRATTDELRAMAAGD